MQEENTNVIQLYETPLIQSTLLNVPIVGIKHNKYYNRNRKIQCYFYNVSP